MIRTSIILISFILNLYGAIDLGVYKLLSTSHSLIVGKITYVLTWSRVFTIITHASYLIKSKYVPVTNVICKTLLTISLPTHFIVTSIYAFFIIQSPLKYLEDFLEPLKFFKSNSFDIIINLFSLFGLLVLWTRVPIYINRFAKYTFVLWIIFHLSILYSNYRVYGIWPYEFMNLSNMPFLYLGIFFLYSLTILALIRSIERRRRIKKIKNKIRKRL